MITKTFEIRDRSTFIPVLAIKLVPSCEPDRYLFSRSGYGATSHKQSEYIMLMSLDGGEGYARSDPYEWNSSSRTMHIAHKYISEHFTELNSGDVVCVETIVGERTTPKISERLEETNYGS